MENIILKTDSYKTSHYAQYPAGTTEVSSYIEARGGGTSTLFFGLQAWLKTLRPIDIFDISLAADIYAAHGVPFNKPGWMHILNKHGGNLPLEIQALPEGMHVPISIPLVQVRNTDPTVPWLTSYMETAMLRSVWYPTTVATISDTCKGVIRIYLNLTADDPEGELPFKLHDFGARGASSSETAMLGGMAHLVNFMGTDTVEAIVGARRFYDIPMAGFSIPASEHSTITAWGQEGELDAYRNMLLAYPNSPLIACVSDSYDIFNACDNIWGGVLKERVQRLGDNGRTLVIRPDSGDPKDTVLRVLDILFHRFGYTTNTKGYKVLPKYVRIIQGDGVNPCSIEEILSAMKAKGYSASNIAFGMGGALLQKCDRDTFKFAMKSNEVVVAGTRRAIWKDPFTDKGKRSKRGRQAVVNWSGIHSTLEAETPDEANLLTTVWRDGSLLVDHKFEDIRKRAAS